MAALVRLIAPDAASGKGKFQIAGINGKTYDPQGAEYVDANPSDADRLAANGWTAICTVGASTDRPQKSGPSANNAVIAQQGVHFIDTTLNAMLVFDNHNWHNVLTGAEVA